MSANPDIYPSPGILLARGCQNPDRGLWEALIPAGYVRFAKGPDMDYDPVCFGLNSRKKNGEMRVVKIDHEEVLCNCGVKVVAESAPTFEDLVLQTIKLAAATK